jgi:molybdopterin-guanine dinucleotide biosynthesis protein A
MSIPPILSVLGDPAGDVAAFLEHLIPVLSAGGIKVGLVRCCVREGLLGPCDKSSARPAGAGACPSIVATPQAMSAESAAGGGGLLDLAAEFGAGCDVLLAEGFPRSPCDRILVLPPGRARPQQGAPEPVALVVADQAGSPPGSVSRGDLAAISAWVQRWLTRRRELGRGVMGAVLIGGRSKRMGTDKAAMCIGGQPVLPRLAELLASRTGGVWMIGRPPPEIGLPRCVQWHLDLRSGCGPLGGIATALRVASAVGRQAVLVVACDMPRLTGGVLDLLLAGRRQDRPATAIRNPSTGRVEPLAAVYEMASLEEVERALNAGELSATRLLDRIGAHIVDPPATWAECLMNANTPEERNEIDNSTTPRPPGWTEPLTR